MEDFENEVNAGMEQAAMAARLCRQSAPKIKLKFGQDAGQTQTARLGVSGLHVIIFLRLDLIDLVHRTAICSIVNVQRLQHQMMQITWRPILLHP